MQANESDGSAKTDATAAAAAMMKAEPPVPGNALARLLRRPVTIDLGVAWDESVRMSFSLERPGSWETKKRLERIGVEIAAEDVSQDDKVETLVASFVALVLDAHGVPGLEPRGHGETREDFAGRLECYIREADAAWLVVAVMTEYLSEKLAPEVARTETFRP